MVATYKQEENRAGTAQRPTERPSGTAPKTNSAPGSSSLAIGLGWFSIGLGLAEIMTPGGLAGLIGVRDNKRTRGLLLGYGIREIVAGIGILSQPRVSGWLWARVAGDALDLSSLGSAFTSSRNCKARLAGATAAVVGVTVLDVLCAQSLDNESRPGSKKKASTATKTVALECSAEEAYRFWRNFENLPRFMTYLESVRITGDRQSHWIANGPAGAKIEWDAQIVQDEPNHLIAWKSADGSFFGNAGSVRFEPFPGRKGCILRAEIDFAPEGGVLNSSLGKVLGMDIGRRVQHDIRNFKQVIELGEVTQSDASIHESMHPAQPSARTAA